MNDDDDVGYSDPHASRSQRSTSAPSETSNGREREAQSEPSRQRRRAAIALLADNTERMSASRQRPDPKAIRADGSFDDRSKEGSNHAAVNFSSCTELLQREMSSSTAVSPPDVHSEAHLPSTADFLVGLSVPVEKLRINGRQATDVFPALDRLSAACYPVSVLSETSSLQLLNQLNQLGDIL
eukprot:ANDGO_07452.mRNA.1 hypothetical protein